MTLETIINQIKQNSTEDKILIGIEGFGGSGKSTLAHNLATKLGDAYVISIDDFIIKDNILDDDWERVFDRQRLEIEVLKPFKLSRAVSYGVLEWDSNTLSGPVVIPDVTYLIIEGISCYNPSIFKYYDYRIWIDTSPETAKARGRQRDAGNDNEKHWDLWGENDLKYLKQYNSSQIANFVIEN